jgi:hypothetical protein
VTQPSRFGNYAALGYSALPWIGALFDGTNPRETVRGGRSELPENLPDRAGGKP